ncbi:hypothetical protein [Aeromicrobium sp. UC242_57]|uniref:hypothetical protein n=1 Tax=Aeromicrobium sp. UC242_57 TaxID=3374624 RepID=UPI0037A06FCA
MMDDPSPPSDVNVRGKDASRPDDVRSGLRAFILEQASGRTEQTIARYVQVADDFMTFLAEVDVTPWLGPELAAHLDAQRRQPTGHDFLATLGLMSLVRVLPSLRR